MSALRMKLFSCNFLCYKSMHIFRVSDELIIRVIEAHLACYWPHSRRWGGGYIWLIKLDNIVLNTDQVWQFTVKRRSNLTIQVKNSHPSCVYTVLHGFPSSTYWIHTSVCYIDTPSSVYYSMSLFSIINRLSPQYTPPLYDVDAPPLYNTQKSWSQHIT